jgi:hypothetical protein
MNNKSILQKRTTTVLIVANIFVLALYVGGWSHLTPRHLQNQGKEIVRQHQAKNEPVEIVDFKIKDKPIKFSEKFEGDSDWLRTISFKVKNKSNKPITWLRVDLTFPETSATGHILLHQLFLGQRADLQSTLSNQPLYLMPNESLEVTLTSQYDQIKRLIEGRQPPIDKITKIEVGLGEVMFDDETLYSGGSIFKRNPNQNSRRKWVIVNDQATSSNR